MGPIYYLGVVWPEPWRPTWWAPWTWGCPIDYGTPQYRYLDISTGEDFLSLYPPEMKGDMLIDDPHSNFVENSTSADKQE